MKQLFRAEWSHPYESWLPARAVYGSFLFDLSYKVPSLFLIDASPSIWITWELYTKQSITASATAPLPSFACHAPAPNCEHFDIDANNYLNDIVIEKFGERVVAAETERP